MSDAAVFAVTAIWSSDGVVFVVIGELDLAATMAWDACVGEVLEQMPSAITVDLAETTFVDSSGLRLLILLQQRAVEQGVALGVVNISGSVARLLEVTGIIEFVGPPSSDTP